MADITNSTTTKALPPDMEAASAAGLRAAVDQFHQPYRSASVVDQRFPQTLPAAFKAAHKLAEETGAYKPDLDEARVRAMNAHNSYPQEFRRYMNPAIHGIEDMLTQQLQQQFARNHAQLAQQFAGRGVNPGTSTLYDNLNAALQNQHGQNLHDARYKLLADMYKEGTQTFGAEQERALEIAKFLATMGQATQAGKMQDILAQLQAMDVVVNDEEKRRAFAHAGREDAINHPQEKINQLLAVVSGRPYSTTSRYTATQSHVQPSMRRNDYAAAMLPHAASFMARVLAPPQSKETAQQQKMREGYENEQLRAQRLMFIRQHGYPEWGMAAPPDDR